MNQTNNTHTCDYKYMLRDTVTGDTMPQARSGEIDIRQWAICKGIKKKKDHFAAIFELDLCLAGWKKNFSGFKVEIQNI